MDWITGLEQALAYIEDHITEELDYDEIAKKAFSSSYHFQRVFSILCGYTLGEYIRNRRLSLAGLELATGNCKVIDVALKYGYESPDSFAKAFQKFHGITPSQARSDRQMLKSFSKLSIKITLEGGSIMNYRIEEKPEMILTGYKRKFIGTPAEREDQESGFYVTTRANQYILKGLSKDYETQYNVMTNFDDEGYDFYIASRLDKWHTENLAKALGSEEDAMRFEQIIIPKGLYLICETVRCEYPTMIQMELRKRAVTEWLPSSGYELNKAPEISVIHWFPKHRASEANQYQSRYIELWLPIIPKK